LKHTDTLPEPGGRDGTGSWGVALEYSTVTCANSSPYLDIGCAATERFAVLCGALVAAANCTLRNLGLEHTDMLLEDKNTIHVLFALLGGDRGHAPVWLALKLIGFTHC
jgi:hypothetical protein